jgi:hypothetical protein
LKDGETKTLKRVVPQISEFFAIDLPQTSENFARVNARLSNQLFEA